MEQESSKRPRRVRYKGTHPKTFEAKYKELQPEKYRDTIDKIIQKGNTPAGMHRPICVDEMMEILHIQPGQVGLDATLGYGGHTLEILKRLNHQGHLYAFDEDSVELPRTTARLRGLGYDETILTIQHKNFRFIDELIYEAGLLQFVLADLGVSSMQLDNPKRGFSYKKEGPLDLRLNPSKGKSGAEKLKSMKQEEIETMLKEHSDEPYASIIAKAIIQTYQKKEPIETTSQLRKVITQALHFLPAASKEETIKKTCQRCFQALRMEVNHELIVLQDFLHKLPACLQSGGRVAILSFHSGEDRLVKKSFQHFFREGIYREISPEAIRPSKEEQQANSRSRSAKLRWAIKA